MSISDGFGDTMGSHKIEGLKVSEISELARIEFKRNEKTTRNYLGKPYKKIKRSVLRQLQEHRKFLKDT